MVNNGCAKGGDLGPRLLAMLLSDEGGERQSAREAIASLKQMVNNGCAKGGDLGPRLLAMLLSDEGGECQSARDAIVELARLAHCPFASPALGTWMLDSMASTPALVKAVAGRILGGGGGVFPKGDSEALRLKGDLAAACQSGCRETVEAAANRIRTAVAEAKPLPVQPPSDHLPAKPCKALAKKAFEYAEEQIAQQTGGKVKPGELVTPAMTYLRNEKKLGRFLQSLVHVALDEDGQPCAIHHRFPSSFAQEGDIFRSLTIPEIKEHKETLLHALARCAKSGCRTHQGAVSKAIQSALRAGSD
jgi:hypothetical protein